MAQGRDSAVIDRTAPSARRIASGTRSDILAGICLTPSDIAAPGVLNAAAADRALTAPGRRDPAPPDEASSAAH